MVPADTYKRPDLDKYEKAVLVGLCSFADNKSGECWPSIKTIAKRTGLGETTVKTALKSLEAKMVISRKNRVDSTNSGTDSNLYTILEWIDNDRPERIANGDSGVGANVNKNCEVREGGRITSTPRTHSDQGGSRIASTSQAQDDHKLYSDNYTKETIRKISANMQHPDFDVPMNRLRYESLCTDYGKEVADRYIEKVDNYVNATGRKPYKDYASAAANFMSRDNLEKRKAPTPRPTLQFLKDDDYE